MTQCAVSTYPSGNYGLIISHHILPFASLLTSTPKKIRPLIRKDDYNNFVYLSEKAIITTSSRKATSVIAKKSDQNQYPSNCAQAPPLIQH